MRNDFDWAALEAAFQEYYPTMGFTQSFIVSVCKNFSGSFDDGLLCSFMETACENTESADHAVRYFCAICWRKIKSGDIDGAMLERRQVPRERPIPGFNKPEAAKAGTVH
jgi:hypothetical protein